MKQLGISLKQESSVIKIGKKKAERKKDKENKDYPGRCWLGPFDRVPWWRQFALLLLFFSIWGCVCQHLIMEAVCKNKFSVTVLWILRNLNPRGNKNEAFSSETELHNMRIAAAWCCILVLFWLIITCLKNCPLSEGSHCAVWCFIPPFQNLLQATLVLDLGS